MGRENSTWKYLKMECVMRKKNKEARACDEEQEREETEVNSGLELGRGTRCFYIW